MTPVLALAQLLALLSAPLLRWAQFSQAQLGSSWIGCPQLSLAWCYSSWLDLALLSSDKFMLNNGNKLGQKGSKTKGKLLILLFQFSKTLLISHLMVKWFMGVAWHDVEYNQGLVMMRCHESSIINFQWTLWYAKNISWRRGIDGSSHWFVEHESLWFINYFFVREEFICEIHEDDEIVDVWCLSWKSPKKLDV